MPKEQGDKDKPGKLLKLKRFTGEKLSFFLQNTFSNRKYFCAWEWLGFDSFYTENMWTTMLKWAQDSYPFFHFK